MRQKQKLPFPYRIGEFFFETVLLVLCYSDFLYLYLGKCINLIYYSKFPTSPRPLPRRGRGERLESKNEIGHY